MYLCIRKIHFFRHDEEDGCLYGNRDVAQLVAHYVRDVGVGRSSRLIPTNHRQAACYQAVFL